MKNFVKYLYVDLGFKIIGKFLIIQKKKEKEKGPCKGQQFF